MWLVVIWVGELVSCGLAIEMMGDWKNDNNNNNKIIIIRYDRAVLPHNNGSCGYPARFLLNTWSLNEYWMNLLWADGEFAGISNACL